MKCIVCKQEFKESDVKIETPNGFVHEGQCQQFLNDLPITENVDEVLNETQLLTD